MAVSVVGLPRYLPLPTDNRMAWRCLSPPLSLPAPPGGRFFELGVEPPRREERQDKTIEGTTLFAFFAPSR
jgi:hypothetical protein